MTSRVLPREQDVDEITQTELLCSFHASIFYMKFFADICIWHDFNVLSQLNAALPAAARFQLFLDYLLQIAS